MSEWVAALRIINAFMIWLVIAALVLLALYKEGYA